MKLGEAVYKAQQEAEASKKADSEPVNNDKEDIVDAEFEEVDKK